MINGLRVKQAREIRKLTQMELASRIGVHQSVIGKMETTIREWSDNIIQSAALVLGFSVSFFSQGIGPEFPLGSLLFRCRADLPANEKARIRQLALIEYEICEKLAVGTRPIQLNFPHLNNTDPIEAARVTRATLGLSPDAPIPHLVNKLEKNGVFVMAVPGAPEGFEAFSLWSDSDPRRPVVVINPDKPTDRLRLSCAHEIGHLALHRSPRGNLIEMEKDAYAFSSEFLMPEEAMRLEIRTPISLSDLARLKPRWGVSIQALIRRARDLELLTERQYRYFFEQISKMGWRKCEPPEFDIKPERPRLLSKLAEIAYGVPSNPRKVAELASIPIGLAEQILAVHAQKADMPRRSESVDDFESDAKPPNNLIRFSRKKAN
jgi:Zn-dependent peptidase ImmA (M78 family)